MNMRMHAQFSVGGGEMAGETETEEPVRNAQPPHSHDDQQKACGTGWVKAATITLPSNGSP